ncbi:MAG: phage tail protein I [Aquabacterium sp.]
MRLIPDAGTLLMRGLPHWRRCAFQDTALLGDELTLAPDTSAKATAWPAAQQVDWGGLAFDARCRLFHAVVDAAQAQGHLEYVVWGDASQLGVPDGHVHPFVVTGPGNEADGESTPATADLPQQPTAIASDEADYLYVTDPARSCVWLVDTWQQEVARRIDFAQVPLDVAACGAAVFVLLADGSTWQIGPCDAPVRTTWPAVPGAARLTVSKAVQSGVQGPYVAWVLVNPGAMLSKVQALHNTSSITLADVIDIVSGADDAATGTPITLATQPGQDFVQIRWLGRQPAVQSSGLSAPGYDGSGIAIAPDGRIAYWTAQGLRHAAPARRQYRTRGLVFGFALDSGHDQSTWGRLQIEACVPQGTAVKVWAFTRDDLDYIDALPAKPPVGVADPDFTLVPQPELTPLLSAQVWAMADEDGAGTLYRDESQRPLSPAPEEGMSWFDAPVMAPPGRYLWLVLELQGTRHKTPRIRSVRAEYPGHALLRHLPRTLWNELPARDFLHRFLMPMAAMLDEWEGVSTQRHRLLDPRITPGDALPWLGSFIGLALDPCWPEAVRRQMVQEAAGMFRTRGTVASLRRMIEILTEGAKVVILENFRLRGGGVVGNDIVNESQAVLGVGFRVGGLIGDPQVQPMADAGPVDFDEFAHRFTVIVAAALNAEQLRCVQRLIELHKPAHTDFTLCTADSGIRVGVGTHVGISAVVGQGAGFEPAIVGEAALGVGYLLGRPELDGLPSAATTEARS